MVVPDVRPAVVVRAAVADDALLVSSLGSHIFSQTFGHSVQPLQLQAYLEEAYSVQAIAADIANPSKTMLVATVNGSKDIIAFALLTRGTTAPCISHLKNVVELQRIYVHPEQHRNGVGKRLAELLESMARQEGFLHIWLGVWEENHKARQVYERLGYKKVGAHDFVIGGNVQTDDIMVKQL